MRTIVDNISEEKLQELEERLSKRAKRSPLKLREVDFIKYKTTKKLLNKILLLNMSHCTLYVKSDNIQCIAGRNRSMGDLFLIAKYYKPDITFKEVRIALFNLCSNFKVGSFYCSTIHKRIFYKNTPSLRNRDNYTSSGEVSDEFGLRLSWSDGAMHRDNLDELNKIRSRY